MRQAKEAASKALLDGYARVDTPNKAFGEVLARSLTDVALLQVRRGRHRFTAAGVPWFLGLFGRDSLLPTIQCLAFNSDLGRHTTDLWRIGKERKTTQGLANSREKSSTN